MRKILSQLSLMIISALFSLSVCHADILLPKPQTKGGMGLFFSLKKRASTQGGAFPVGKLFDEELSTLLWSASGLNRGKNGWTVPMANGKPPYVRLYVAGEKGVFLYEWQEHFLREISDKDIRAEIAMQSFTKRAAYSFIFVSDGQALASLSSQQANDFSQMATGAISQNIYLAASALKLSARYIHSIKPEVIAKSLKLDSNSMPIGLMLIGK